MRDLAGDFARTGTPICAIWCPFLQHWFVKTPISPARKF
jgi:hypothetical protein